MPPELLISPELARDISELSFEIGRQVGLLVDRSGAIDTVLIGDGRGLVLPEMGRARGGLTRLKGLRLVHTHLFGEGLTQDDLNDLAALRLDMVAMINVGQDGLPQNIEAAHLLPANEGGETMARLSAPNLTELNLDFISLIRSLEEEFTRTQDAAFLTEAGEKAILVSSIKKSKAEVEDNLAELEDLAKTAGLLVVDKIILRRPRKRGSRLLSQQRLSDLAIKALQLGADLFVFGQNLNPAEITWITNQIELRIIDRTQLILDIFAMRALSREGRIQVELAQLSYLMPRLVTKNTALSRLAGGIGGRGPGETKLEINRRRVRDRIDRLKKDLKAIKQRRGRHRARRAKQRLPIVSIVGYTNAGKSTLLNGLTKSNILVENRLFATLDPTSRTLKFPKNREIIITDTVGFIRDLPPDLLEAFAATLEELSAADLLLHLIDASNPRFPDQINAVEGLLSELDLAQIPTLRVLNKTDRLDNDTVKALEKSYSAISLSALDSKTFPGLISELEKRLDFRS